MQEQHQFFMQEAIRLAIQGMQSNQGGPFGSVIVKDGEIIGKGNNKVVSTNDPTAHAEIVAIRNACKHLGTFQLPECIIYTSCEPCPMCLGAIYWARPQKIIYACSREDAAAVGFDDDFIYQEINQIPQERTIAAEQIMQSEGLKAFQLWLNKEDKISY